MRTERRTAHRLLDILDAIADIRAALEDENFNSFVANGLKRAAVSHYLLIVSEASRHLPPSVIQSNPATPWRKIADLGNVLRHAYHDINPAILWDIYENQLDALETIVRQAQADYPDVGA